VNSLRFGGRSSVLQGFSEVWASKGVEVCSYSPPSNAGSWMCIALMLGITQWNGLLHPVACTMEELKRQVQSPSGVRPYATSTGQPLLGPSPPVMAPIAIAPKGVVKSGGSDPTVEVIVLDDHAATPREVPPVATAIISMAGVTGDTGSGDGMEPPANGEQPAPRMRGEASKVSEPVGTSSYPAEALT
jgi:hypothetical protein